MSLFILTLISAFVVVVLAFLCMAIGWLITGKSKIKGGMCGRDPTKKKESKSCGDDVRCDLCEDDDEKKRP